MKQRKRGLLTAVTGVILAAAIIPASPASAHRVAGPENPVTTYYTDTSGYDILESITSVGTEPQEVAPEGYVLQEKIDEVYNIYTQSYAPYIDGYPEGDFRPENLLSRAEACKLLYSLYHIEPGQDTVKIPEDVSEDDWYYDAVAAMYKAGILDGYEDGTFRPKNNITRAEFSKIVAKINGLEIEKGETKFTDISNHWAYDQIVALEKSKWISGYPDGTFLPDSNIKRCETVKIANSATGRIALPEAISDANNVSMRFGDVEKKHWAYYEILVASSSYDESVVDDVDTLTVHYVDMEGKEIKESSVSEVTFTDPQNSEIDKDIYTWAGANEVVTYVYNKPSVVTVSTWSDFVNSTKTVHNGDTIKLENDIIEAGDEIDAVSTATPGAVALDDSITIDGQNHIIKAGENTGFCFEIAGKQINIKNLTIDGASYGKKIGGAIFVENGANLNLESVTFKNCNAKKATLVGNGGGVLNVNKGATVNANNCSFIDNYVGASREELTGRGGAIYSINGSTTNLTGCTFKGNKAAYGGAIAVMGKDAKISINGCDFAGNNDAVYGGDDIYIFDGYTYVKKGFSYDSSVTYDIGSDNIYDPDGETWQDYSVVMARVLGEVYDTTTFLADSSYNSAKPINGIKLTCVGNGNPQFLPGWDLTFNSTNNYERTSAPETEICGPTTYVSSIDTE